MLDRAVIGLKNLFSFSVLHSVSAECLIGYFFRDGKEKVNSAIFVLKKAFDFCRFCVVIRFFHIRLATMANDLRLRFYPLHLFSYFNSLERASIFPFECSVLNKGTTGTVFITFLV